MSEKSENVLQSIDIISTMHFIEKIKSFVKAFMSLYKGRSQLCDLLLFLYRGGSWG